MQQFFLSPNLSWQNTKKSMTLLSLEVKKENVNIRSSPPETILGKGVLKICSKFTGELPCRSVILIKLMCIFIKITLRNGCSPVNLLITFRISFPRNTSGRLLLIIQFIVKSRAVCIIETQLQKIMCSGFSSKITQKRGN